MSYHDKALPYLKKSNPCEIGIFEKKYKQGVNKIMSATHIFRLMSFEESQSWNKLSAPDSTGVKPTLIKLVFNPDTSQYHRKWFTFDRPYRFSRQTINQRDTPKKNIANTREGQEFLMVISLSYPLKHTIIKKMLPDVTLRGLPKNMLKDSSRCKIEGGTITLGLSLAVLEKIAINLTIEKLGGRLVPRF